MARRRGVTLFKRDRAREFRKHPTASEVLAWELLRDRRMLGLKFRRQQVIDGYVVDFFCVECGLVLEIDGEIHIDPAQHKWDMKRSMHMRGRGLVVLRVSNTQVGKHHLERLLIECLNHGPPLPLAGEGQGVRATGDRTRSTFG
jgi:very-short-patch-repair endonuclease